MSRRLPLRVLLIGNIANNAFYAATLLRRRGVEADVFVPDDYWVMSSPEWEEADFDGVPADQIYPDWWSMDLRGYRRPRWFAQGPFTLAADYLLATRSGEGPRADKLWTALDDARRSIARHPEHKLVAEPAATRRGRVTALTAHPKARRFRSLLARTAKPLIARVQGDAFLRRAESLVTTFAHRFPERTDRLTVEEILPYRDRTQSLARLFPHYDVVHGNATDPMYPMLAAHRPYVALEHGTLRDSPEVSWQFKGPFFPNTIGRLTALSYALADHVFITNADVRSSAQRLRLDSYSPIPHPFDEAAFAPDPEAGRAILSRLGVDHLFLCPIRHDWLEKGTDLYIRALPELRRRVSGRFKACFMPWGKEIERSKQLVRELGCEDLVEWVGPYGRVGFVRWMSAASVVWDQLAYASFSGLGPRAMAAGAPVVAAYDHAGLAWMFPEPAPILAARTVEDVVAQTLRALAPGFRRDYEIEARRWIAAHHSSDVVASKLIQAYEAARAAHGPRRGFEHA